MRWARHVACLGDKQYKHLVKNSIQKRLLGRSQYGLVNHVNSDINKTVLKCVNSIIWFNKDWWQAPVNMIIFRFHKMRDFMTSQAIVSFYETTLVHVLVHDLFIPHGILDRSDVWKSYTFIFTIIIYVCFHVEKSSFYSSVLFGSASSATSSASSYTYVWCSDVVCK